MEQKEDELYPIAVLVEELKNEDVQLRLNSLRQISTIAQAIGQERTRSELIPYLGDATEDEDEVLLVLAEELGNLIEFVGGGEYAHTILPPLAKLAAAEEAIVRDRAVMSIGAISKELAEEQIQDFLYPLVAELSKSDWFTSRCSAALIAPYAYPSVDEETKGILRATFAKLCKDETPMVRTSAARALSNFVPALNNKTHLKQDVIPSFVELSQDDHDTIRMLAPPNSVALAKVLTEDENLLFVVPTLKSCVRDRSWRVRYSASEHFCEISELVGPEVTKSELVESFIALLRDNEEEVRACASLRIAEFCAQLRVYQELVQSDLLPIVRDLSQDFSESVRIALSSSLTELAPVVGKEAAVSRLVPLYLAMLRGTLPEPKINIVSKLDSITQVISLEVLASDVLPVVVELFEDREWRVRQSVVQYIPNLAIQLGVQFFDDKLVELCMIWLRDSVCAIRHSAAENLLQLTEVFGLEWAQRTILPPLLKLLDDSNYQIKQIGLDALALLAPELGTEVLTRDVLPPILGLKGDTIPNVKFASARALGKLIPHLEENTIQQQVKPCLSILEKDTDPDVQFFSKQALEKTT